MKVKHIYVLSAIILLITSIFSVGYHHFDEHFQILEFAGLKLNITEVVNLPWEYQYQMRSAIQPSIVVILYNIFDSLGINNPFIITFFFRLLSAALAFLGMHLIYTAYYKTIFNDIFKKWFLFLSFFLWFLFYNNVRFSAENWSGCIFLVAFSLLQIKQSSNNIFYLYVGLILGFSFLFRFQAGLLIVGLIMWYTFIQKNIVKVILLLIGVIIIFGIGVLIDRWFYGEWTITSWNYFNQTIIQENKLGFGNDPWWFYFEKVFIKAIPPISIIIILSVIIFLIFKRNDILTWTIFPFLLIHFFIGQKGIRFLFPIIGFLPIIIIKSIELIQEKLKRNIIDYKFVKLFARLFWVVNIIFILIVAFRPADNHISLYKQLYNDFKEPTTVYYTDANPYQRVLDIYFYKRKNLVCERINSINEIYIDSCKNQLFITKDKNSINDFKLQKKLVYSTFPKWIEVFNFNNWIESSNSWYVYKLF